ncbi:MAG: hypothetical protein KF883_15295 [Thermomicrobiales bacterium]|nr:hypothetical protein [Thermomicrobiales bacterium]
MAQIDPVPNYDHQLAQWATLYLQTKDPALFPFTREFDQARKDAFIYSLRVGLADLQDSGSARKTSATGFIMTDTLLHQIVHEWASAHGNWPPSADPSNPDGLIGWLRARA